MLNGYGGLEAINKLQTKQIQALAAAVAGLKKVIEAERRLTKTIPDILHPYGKERNVHWAAKKLNDLTTEVEAQAEMLSQKDATARMQTKRHKCDQIQLAENIKTNHRLAKETVTLKAEISRLKAASEEATTDHLNPLIVTLKHSIDNGLARENMLEEIHKQDFYKNQKLKAALDTMYCIAEQALKEQEADK